MASSSPLEFYVVDNRTDRILYTNRRFCEIWGMARAFPPAHADGHPGLRQVLQAAPAEPGKPDHAQGFHPLHERPHRTQLLHPDALGILRKLGLCAGAVADGSEALNALSTLPYDLVLMDMHMPVMDGQETTRRIRAADSNVLNLRIPIVKITANTLPSDRLLCKETAWTTSCPSPSRSRNWAASWRHGFPPRARTRLRPDHIVLRIRDPPARIPARRARLHTFPRMESPSAIRRPA